VRMAESSAKGKLRTMERTDVQSNHRLTALEEAFQSYFGTKVKIRLKSGGKGKFEVHFYSEDDLNRLCEILGIEI